jgi:hypothetical protein
MAWRETGAAPGRIVTTFAVSRTDPTVLRTQAGFPYPNIAVWTGQGDPNDQATWRESAPQHRYRDHYDWLGNNHYTPQYQRWYRPTVVPARPGTTP